MYFNYPDLTPLLRWALVGMALTGIAALAAILWLVWFAVHHVSIY